MFILYVYSTQYLFSLYIDFPCQIQMFAMHELMRFGKGNFSPNKNSRLCCIHFNEASFTALTERVFRRYTATCNGKPTNRKNTKQKVLTGVLSRTCNTSLFENLQEHMYDTEITDNHFHKLCKAIINKYLEVRFHYEARSFTLHIRGLNIRIKEEFYISNSK